MLSIQQHLDPINRYMANKYYAGGVTSPRPKSRQGLPSEREVLAFLIAKEKAKLASARLS